MPRSLKYVYIVVRGIEISAYSNRRALCKHEGIPYPTLQRAIKACGYYGEKRLYAIRTELISK